MNSATPPKFPKSDRRIKQEKIASLYSSRLNNIVSLFYEQVGDDEQYNERLFNDFNLAWKRLVHNVNRTQKVVHIDPQAFSMQIEHYKQKAHYGAIKAQEHGTIGEKESVL